jgi:hypothetical protein
MIAEICFTADWLEKKRKELRGVDPGLLERALHAFALLGHLAESELKFVFKGGTSLLLHVPVIKGLRTRPIAQLHPNWGNGRYSNQSIVLTYSAC